MNGGLERTMLEPPDNAEWLSEILYGEESAN